MIDLWLGVSCVVCLVLFIRTLQGVICVPVIRDTPAPQGRSSPLVSVLVPVRNEASRALRSCLCSLIEQSYSRLEIVAVDDSSTDASLSIMRELERTAGGRLRVVASPPCPAGWLGKTAALQYASSFAAGEWLLFADGDGIFARHVVSATMDFVSRNRLDALTLVPAIESSRFWPAVMLPAFTWVSTIAVSPAQANRERSRACCGFGSFILVNREAHAAIGGFERYRTAIIDDSAVMVLLKRAGFRVMVADGRGVVRTDMYSSLREVFHGYGKNAFAGLRFSYALLIAALLIEGFVFLAPFSYCLYSLTTRGTLNPLAGLSASLFFATMLCYGWRTRADVRFFLFYPLGHAAMLAVTLYSAYLYTWGQGGHWKGRTLRRGLWKPLGR